MTCFSKDLIPTRPESDAKEAMWVDGIDGGVWKLLRILLTFCLLQFFFSLSSAQSISNTIEQKFINAGLVDVSSIDKTLQVDLVNSDPLKNFFRENYYGDLKKAYLRKSVAIKLSNAQKILKKQYPHLSLQILDAARPRAVSKAMYLKMKGTKFEKYVAHPAKGSMHNYGIAVDITIVDGAGKGLDMGPSPFKKSLIAIYWQYAKMKMGLKLTKKQSSNRLLLADVMHKAGFYPLAHEWWHFNGMKKNTARKQFKIIE